MSHCSLCATGAEHGVREHLAALRPFTPDPTTLYLGDNGRCYCGAHLGACGKATGADLSGQRLLPLTRMEIVRDGFDPDLFVCEEPGCGRKVVA